MIRNPRVIQDVARRIARTAESAVGDHAENLVEQEPQLTDRFLGRIAQSIEGYESKGVRWDAKTLTDRAPGAQEKRYGADFVGVLKMKFETYSVKKGFLAQAKLLKSSLPMNKKGWKRMRTQCENMLELSSDSFIFTYSRDSIRVILAMVILGLTDSAAFKPEAFYSRSIGKFFEEHFACFIGDHRISDPTIQTLENLRARRLLFLWATHER